MHLESRTFGTIAHLGRLQIVALAGLHGGGDVHIATMWMTSPLSDTRGDVDVFTTVQSC